MATTDTSPITKPAAPPNALRRRRGLWMVGALLVAGACASGYNWAFGKPKVLYSSAAVERDDIETTVVAAGVLQAIQYGRCSFSWSAR